MRQNFSGQTMVEALFVVVFTSIVMFAFLQVCIMVVDDMTANEAAFVAMRSAAVTKSENREKEAVKRVENYLFIFYPLSSLKNNLNRGSLVYSDLKTVAPYYKNDNDNNPDDYADDEIDEGSKSITIYDYERGISDAAGNPYKDYSGNTLKSDTVKFYYFTRVMFGSLVAKATSKRDRIYSGYRRYQSARSRTIPSPDSEFYNKAYPGAKTFDE